VTYEYKLPGGKSVDVVAEKNGKRTAIEVETGRSNSIYNIRKDLEAEFDEVISVVLNDKIKEKILLKLKISGLAKELKIKIISLTEFLKWLGNKS